jgi:hypothetical protein
MPFEPVEIPVSPGELIDRLTILQIKTERITDPGRNDRVKKERQRYEEVRERRVPHSEEIGQLTLELKQTNEKLWDIEDHIRIAEKDQLFDKTFIGLARSVYKTNDRRAALKRQIDSLLNSVLAEEKEYVDYE